MENAEAAFEVDVDLDAEALQQERSRQSGHRSQRERSSIDTSWSTTPEERDETSPLLSRRREDGGQNEDDDGLPPYSEYDEMAKLPWYNRPSIFWILGPFFLMTCAFGGILTPKMNLMLQLVCREYFSERAAWDPNFTYIPIDFKSGDNDQCRVPEVQSRVAQLSLWGSLIGGLLSAITSPKLGALSDRYGRKKILIITSIGTICGEIITICAATYPNEFPVKLLLLSYAVDGLTGSFIVAMAIANSYATDCTPPARRNVAFGYFHGCLFGGIAIGPILAGYIVKVTGDIVIVFWVLLGVHVFFILFVTFCAPESLSKKKQLAAREKHTSELAALLEPERSWLTRLRSYNLLEPLKVLWPTGPGSSPALRRNLFFLAAVDTTMFGVAMGSIMIVVIYTNYMFGWGTFESGRFVSIVNTSRVFFLLVVLPTATRIVRGKPLPAAQQKNKGCDLFDLTIIRIAVFFDTIGYAGFALARTPEVLILSGVVAAAGGMASPMLQSSMTKHVPNDKTGALLGASGLLHALARVVAPTMFNAIYAATVGSFPQAVFVCLASTFGLAFLISWFLKTGVYFDEEKAHADRENIEFQSENERFPIIGPVIDAFVSFVTFLGLIARHHH